MWLWYGEGGGWFDFGDCDDTFVALAKWSLGIGEWEGSDWVRARELGLSSWHVI